MAQSILAGFPDKPVPVAKNQKEQVEITGGELGNVQKGQAIQKGAATLPFEGPQAATSLTSSQQKLVSEAADVSGKEADRFTKAEPVKLYTIALPQFAAALRTPHNKEGDSDLVMLSAKIQDPIGSVREGDEQRFQNLQAALERLPKRFQEEFTGNGGVFTEGTRTNIRRILTNRLRAYNMGYKRERQQATSRIKVTNNRLKASGLPETFLIDPVKEVVGPHLGDTFAADVKAYTEQQQAAAAPERKTVGLTEPLPAGAQIEGEDVKGYRFTPEQTAQADAYKQSKNFTAEGWADMITGFAKDIGIVTPDTAGSFRDNALSVGSELAKAKAAGKPLAPGFNYEEVDKAASQNAGLGASVAQGLRNLPESAAQLAMGVMAIPKDAIASVVTGERVGLYKTLPDLAGELIRQAGGAPTGENTAAISKMLEERYGGLDNIQRAAIKDPVGIVGDLSMLLTAGGSTAARVPGVIGKVGEGVAQVGRVIDPLSAITAAVGEGAPAAYRAARERAPAALEGIENAPSNLVGWPSGAGGASVREATGSGFERGMAGEATPRSEAFTRNMRNAAGAAAETVAAARDAVERLKAQNYQQYLRDTRSLGINPQPLDFSKVQQRIEEIKPANYDHYLNMADRPTEHVAWDRMKRTVDAYAAEAAQNPDLLLPVNVDNFKQNLFDIGSKATGAYDSKATGIANQAYGAVRGLIAEADPLYDAAMTTSREGIEAVKELENAFSLAPGKDRRVNVDAATRKLQSVWRNNASTNYSQRANLADLIAQYDPEGRVAAGGAGQMLSSATPRGMSGTITAGTAFGGAAVNPLTLGLLPTLVPRIVGEGAYAAGRLAGTGARYGRTLLDAVEPYTSEIGELYNRYPTLTLAGAQLGSRDYETERLKNQYGIGTDLMPVGAETPQVTEMPAAQPTPQMPVAAAPEATQPQVIKIGDHELVYDAATDMLVEPATGRRVKDPEDILKPAAMYRGGLMDLARKYR
jgi:hypothetical protein